MVWWVFYSSAYIVLCAGRVLLYIQRHLSNRGTRLDEICIAWFVASRYTTLRQVYIAVSVVYSPSTLWESVTFVCSETFLFSKKAAGGSISSNQLALDASNRTFGSSG